MGKRSLGIISTLLIFSFLGLGASLMEKGSSTGLTTSGPQDKDYGIGPVKSVQLGAIDKIMTADGKNLYNGKCIICHELDQKKIGPALRNVTKVRTPEFIMNLLVNSEQMQKENPVVKKLLKEFNNVPMPDPGFNQSQARSVLEYLRSVAK